MGPCTAGSVNNNVSSFGALSGPQPSPVFGNTSPSSSSHPAQSTSSPATIPSPLRRLLSDPFGLNALPAFSTIANVFGGLTTPKKPSPTMQPPLLPMSADGSCAVEYYDEPPSPPLPSPITPFPQALLVNNNVQVRPMAALSPSTPAMESPTPNTSTLSTLSTSPLTEFSTSPSPPPEFQDQSSYPSPDSTPLSSQLSSIESSPAPEGEGKRMRTDEESAPPTKKRRVSTEPKPRVTQYLDISTTAPTLQTEQKEQYEKLLKVLSKSRKIVVVAGAGISVSSGIPDFRSSKGLFKSLKKQHNLKSSGKDLFDASVYKDSNSTQSFHQMLRELSNMSKNAEPSPFHNMLATLADEGRLLRLYTQNVDGLDTMLPPLATTVPLNRKGPWPKTIQLHGGLQKMVCSKCSNTTDFEAELFDGPEPPSCELCQETDNARTEHAGKRSHGVGCLRPRMVLYNEHNPDDEAIGAVVKADLRTRPDALIVVGTTLKIPGVRRIIKEMGTVVRGRKEGPTIWINVDGPPPGFDWDLIVKGPCDRVAQEANMRLWSDPPVSDEELQKIFSETKVTVETPGTPSTNQQPTPSETPIKIESQQVDTSMKDVDQKISGKKSTIKFVEAGKKQKDKVTKPRKASGPKKPRKKDGAEKNKKIEFTMAKSASTTSLVTLGKKADSGPKEDVNGLQIKFQAPSTPQMSASNENEAPGSGESISPTTGRPRKASLEFILN